MFEKLRCIEVLSTLSDEEIRALSSVVTEIAFDKNTLLMGEGDTSDFLLFLYEGMVKVTRKSASGQELTLSLHSEGDILGEMGLLAHVRRTANVVAYSKGKALKLTKTDFMNFSKNHISLIFVLSGLLAMRLKAITDKAASFIFDDVTTRLLSLLLSSGILYHEGNRRGLLIRELLPHKDMASLLGTSRENISRSLSHLEKSGEIERIDEAIIIWNK